MFSDGHIVGCSSLKIQMLEFSDETDTSCKKTSAFFTILVYVF